MTELAAGWQTPRALQNRPLIYSPLVNTPPDLGHLAYALLRDKYADWPIYTCPPFWEDGGAGEGGATPQEWGAKPPVPPSVS